MPIFSYVLFIVVVVVVIVGVVANRMQKQKIPFVGFLSNDFCGVFFFLLLVFCSVLFFSFVTVFVFVFSFPYSTGFYCARGAAQLRAHTSYDNDNVAVNNDDDDDDNDVEYISLSLLTARSFVALEVHFTFGIICLHMCECMRV